MAKTINNELKGSGSLDSGREDIGKLLTLLGKGGLHDDTIDVPQVWNLLQRIVFSIVLKQLVERIANEQRIFELRQFSELVELVPTLNLVIWVKNDLLPMKRVVNFIHMERPSNFSTWL